MNKLKYIFIGIFIAALLGLTIIMLTSEYKITIQIKNHQKKAATDQDSNYFTY